MSRPLLRLCRLANCYFYSRERRGRPAIRPGGLGENRVFLDEFLCDGHGGFGYPNCAYESYLYK